MLIPYILKLNGKLKHTLELVKCLLAWLVSYKRNRMCVTKIEWQYRFSYTMLCVVCVHRIQNMKMWQNVCKCKYSLSHRWYSSQVARLRTRCLLLCYCIMYKKCNSHKERSGKRMPHPVLLFVTYHNIFTSCKFFQRFLKISSQHTFSRVKIIAIKCADITSISTFICDG